ncbi:MAG: hypothetical protein ACI8UO_001077 [Verrucomicrobiales bacterium]|jgi:hypothetical protein
MIRILLLSFLATAGLFAEEETIMAPEFDGKILGMDVYGEHLGVVLDISESMTRKLPAVRAALREKMPKTPVLHVDGCGLEKPGPQATIKGGVASETVTAVNLLGEFAHANAILWISDMGDSPNHSGIKAMAEALSKHEITLYILSLGNAPGPALRKLVEQTEGAWKAVALE